MTTSVTAPAGPIDSLSETDAVLKLAQTGQHLRRKAHLPANIDFVADQLTARLIAIGGTYSGSTASNLKAAAVGALTVDAGQVAIAAAA